MPSVMDRWRLPCWNAFTMVRSIWVPTNWALHSTAVLSVAIIAALLLSDSTATYDHFPWIFQLAGVLGWLLNYTLLVALRSTEEALRTAAPFSDDELADRRAAPLATLSAISGLIVSVMSTAIYACRVYGQGVELRPEFR